MIAGRFGGVVGGRNPHSANAWEEVWDDCGGFWVGRGRGVLMSVERRGEMDTMARWTLQVLVLLKRRRSWCWEVVKRLCLVG